MPYRPLRTSLLLLGGLISSSIVWAAAPPAPYGPTPSPRQLAIENDEIYAFAHFGVNTFTDREWGNGDEKETVFNPTDFNAERIVKAVKDGGFTGLILTAKHHDGFCLWPSQYTEHSVKNSPWKNGKGDMVKEISDACRKQGVKFGIYLSPWDRSRADYGQPGYLVYYQNQLRELLTNYGPIFEVWLDGANGGKGYYGGANEKRTIDPTTYYQWPDAWVSLIRQLQPGCTIHSDFGPDLRWCGNESGTMGTPSWSTIRNKDLTFASKDLPRNSVGERPGDLWMPAESDVSIRPGWFYHTSGDAKVKSAQTMMNLYFTTVGRGGTLLLNIPPDRRGRIADADVQAMRAFKSLKDRTFKTNLAHGAKVTVSNVRGGDARFDGAKALDGKPGTYWSTDDAVTVSDLTLELRDPATFNVVNLQEYIQLGQRIDAYEVDQWQDNQWVPICSGQSIGHRALIKLDNSVTTDKVRLKITAAAACPALSEFGLYFQPDH